MVDQHAETASPSADERVFEDPLAARVQGIILAAAGLWFLFFAAVKLSGIARLGPLGVTDSGNPVHAGVALLLGLLALSSGILFAVGFRKLRVVLTRDQVRIEGAYRPVEIPYQAIGSVQEERGEIVLVLASGRLQRIEPYYVRKADRAEFKRALLDRLETHRG
jgi:hypothetical protein